MSLLSSCSSARKRLTKMRTGINMCSGKSTKQRSNNEPKHISATFPGESHLLPGVGSTFQLFQLSPESFKALRSVTRSRGFFFPGAIFSGYTRNQSTAEVRYENNPDRRFFQRFSVPAQDAPFKQRLMPSGSKTQDQSQYRDSILSKRTGFIERQK